MAKKQNISTIYYPTTTTLWAIKFSLVYYNLCNLQWSLNTFSTTSINKNISYKLLLNDFSLLKRVPKRPSLGSFLQTEVLTCQPCFHMLSIESSQSIPSAFKNSRALFPCSHTALFMVGHGVSLSHAVVQRSHLCGFLTAHATPTKLQQGSLSWSSNSSGWTWPVWEVRYWLFIIFYCWGEFHCEWDGGSGRRLCFLLCPNHIW